MLYGIDRSMDLHRQFNNKSVFLYWYTYRAAFTMARAIGVPPEIDLGQENLTERHIER